MQKFLSIFFSFIFFGAFAQIPTPIVSVSPAFCQNNGYAHMDNLNPNYTYTFIPDTGGIFVSNGGEIIGLQCGTNYTVYATDGSENSESSAPFSVECMLPMPDAPVIQTIPPNCEQSSLAYITNFDPSLNYEFFPGGPTI